MGKLAREQLDRRLDRVRDAVPHLRTPRGGWLSSLRSGYGMTQAQLAHRMGVSQQAVSQLEKREADESATLGALREAAAALDAELVYAIVPRRSIRDTLGERARRLARRMVGSVRHTMRLEAQDPGSDLEERTEALAAQLLESPGQLWVTSLDE